jgi:hypothetical protein
MSLSKFVNEEKILVRLENTNNSAESEQRRIEFLNAEMREMVVLL